MTIKEVETKTGLSRSNIRFYEKEKLVVPSRNDKNGYRNYSEQDVEFIKKIAYLRTLGISIEDIRRIMAGEVSLKEMIEKQTVTLRDQIGELNRAKSMCDRMLAAGNVSFDEMRVEQFVTELPTHWRAHGNIFQTDSVSFLYLWGSLLVWVVIALLCLVTGAASYAKLPPEIPVQWSDGAAVSFADRNLIFLYPVACVVIRFLLRPVIYVKFLLNRPYGEVITEYLTNYLCFIALSVEVFTILFVCGLAGNVATVLVVDTLVLVGMLLVGIKRQTLSRTRGSQ